MKSSIWDSIRNDQAVNSKLAKKCDVADLYWAVSSDGKNQFWINTAKRPDVKLKREFYGIDIKLMNVTGRYRIVLSCNDSLNIAIFHHFCLELIEELSLTTKDVSVKVFKVVSSWEAFFKLKSKPLSITSQRGLFGELHFLRESMKRLGSVYNWIGPMNRTHDFSFEKAKVEIKTSLSVSNTNIKINSLSQLDTTNHPIFLGVVNVTEGGIAGQSLDELVSDIKKSLSSNEEISFFLKLLIGVGYSDSVGYNKKYVVVKTSFFYVDDEFPKITPENVATEISNVSYNVNLSKITIFTNQIEELMDNL